MVINHTGEYQYRARYYNKAAGTEIFFLPQKTDFTPICFGLDPEDNTKLTDDPETAKPIVLDEAGVYYEIDINVKESTYSMRTYSVTEATNPMKYEYGKPCFVPLGEVGNRSLISYSRLGRFSSGCGKSSCLPDKIILIFSIIRKMELGRWKPVKK